MFRCILIIDMFPFKTTQRENQFTKKACLVSTDNSSILKNLKI